VQFHGCIGGQVFCSTVRLKGLVYACRAYRVSVWSERRPRVLRGPVACQWERKGCAGADCIADVSACLREALKLTTSIRLKLFSFGSGTESPLDGFQSHYQSALVQKWSSDHKIAGNKKPKDTLSLGVPRYFGARDGIEILATGCVFTWFVIWWCVHRPPKRPPKLKVHPQQADFHLMPRGWLSFEPSDERLVRPM